MSKNTKKMVAKRKTNQQKSGPKTHSKMLSVNQKKTHFPEELFNTMFAKKKIEKLVAALKLATDKEIEESKSLLESDYTYSLMVASHKVPRVPVHLSRILLTHTLHNEDSEVALFVKDLKRGRRLDFEPTIQHYENLLREKGVTKYRITVIPVNQLYNEYATFELRRKLSNLYDKFLADSSIAAHVNGFLGSKMLKKGRLAIPLNLKKDNLSEAIDKAMRKVFYKHVNQGITQNIQVGKHIMSNDQIADNIIDLLRQFGEIHPGGYKNVHKLFLRPQANLSVIIPLYVSAEKPLNNVPLDRTAGEKVLQKHSKTAKTILGNFYLNETGKVVQKRRPAASIKDEEMLLSEDEAETPPPVKKVAIDTDTKETKPAPAEKPEPVERKIGSKQLKSAQKSENLQKKKKKNRSPNNNI